MTLAVRDGVVAAAVVEHFAGDRVDHLRLQVRETGVGRAIGDRAVRMRLAAAAAAEPAWLLRGREWGRRRRDGLDLSPPETAAPANRAPVPSRATASTPPVIESARRCFRANEATDAPEPDVPADAAAAAASVASSAAVAGSVAPVMGVVGAASAAPLAGSRAGSPGVVGSPAASVSSVTRRIVRGGPERNLIVARTPAGGRDGRSSGHSPG